MLDLRSYETVFSALEVEVEAEDEAEVELELEVKDELGSGNFKLTVATVHWNGFVSMASPTISSTL